MDSQQVERFRGMSFENAQERANELDSTDSLKNARNLFDIPADVLYFDGNSLGPLTHASRQILQQTIEVEWRERLIRSWSEDWLAMPARVGDLIAPLIGAPQGTVVCCDNTSINLYKALSAAVGLRPNRKEIVVDIDNFPTDIYIAQSVADQHGLSVKAVKAADMVTAISEDTAVVTATHVDYRTANILDVEGITKQAHRHGALMVWDLAHTTGAVPFDVLAHDIDFAVGCGYKYLNGGPGAPAYIYGAERLLDQVSQPLQGWFGHDAPFAFDSGFRAAPGPGRFLTGTVTVLGMKSLEAALSVFSHASMADIRRKNTELTSFFIDLFDEHLAQRGFTLVSPRDPELRGSHVALGCRTFKLRERCVPAHCAMRGREPVALKQPVV